jgi:glycosyltransferase involved in cell wall biosynthesis
MISVLMPTFNRPDFIRGAIDAILTQDYSDFEIIVKDGGESIEHLLPTDPRIRYIHNKDRGITDAMNQAMKAAKGDIFVWANDDDRITHGTFKYVVENIGDYKWLFGKIKLTTGQTMGGGYSYQELLKANIVPQPAVYWTREAMEEVGYMSEEQDLVSDYEYWLRLGAEFEPKVVDRILAEYTIHNDQITSKIPAQQSTQANIVSQKYGLLNG